MLPIGSSSRRVMNQSTHSVELRLGKMRRRRPQDFAARSFGSLAWRSSRFSRSRTLIRSRSSVVGRARWPWPRSAGRIEFRSVLPEQPILAAIDWIADRVRALLALVLPDQPDHPLANLRGEGWGMLRHGSSLSGVGAPRKPGAVHSPSARQTASHTDRMPGTDSEGRLILEPPVAKAAVVQSVRQPDWQSLGPRQLRIPKPGLAKPAASHDPGRSRCIA